MPHAPPPAALRRGTAAARLALPVAALLLAVGCGESAPEPPEIVRPVKILEIQGAGATLTREYPGTVKAAQTAEMAFEVPGKIVEFRFKEGQEVAEGELLARLDPRDYQARLDSARSEYENARTNFERAQKLFEENALAALERDRRRTVADAKLAELRKAEKAVEDTELRAPFTGILARKLVEDYANVRAKEPVLVLTDDSHLEVKVAVPERDLATSSGRRSPAEATARIRPEVVIPSVLDRSFPARLTEIASTADPETRTFEVTVAFEPPRDVTILPGMTAKVIVHLPPERAGAGIRIPVAAAVADPEGDSFVWVVEPGAMTVHRRPVELGVLVGDDVIVAAGLEDGDLVAVSGVSQLREGMTVRRFGN